MRAHQIMTRAGGDDRPRGVDRRRRQHHARSNHVSGLPVVDDAGKLIGIISEGDFIRRAEIGTQRKRGRWLRLLLGPGTVGGGFRARARPQGRRDHDARIRTPCRPRTPSVEAIVKTMEKHHVKRLPVMQATAWSASSPARTCCARSPIWRATCRTPSAADDKIRAKIVAAIERNDWRPFGLSVLVRDGVVHLNGVITEERSRQAAIVAAENVCGVKEVHDHLCWVDTMSGFYLNSPEDEQIAKTA